MGAEVVESTEEGSKAAVETPVEAPVADLQPAITDPAKAKQVIANLMDTVVRVRISDGRLIMGQLWCVDNLKNLVLLNVQETKTFEDGSEQERPLGPLVMVPGKHIKNIEAVKVIVEAAQTACELANVVRPEDNGESPHSV
eukprot:TRINITY_DN51593_c0_g1_i1.p1 TRINITY_DN51593_c0_g1~~TRINITY_DN51593_c0_g1_i1.p1  ORF type:complete len:141 (-),score=35.62 TRINITY_DN51593_c0_g1_i1:331-753(-)